MKHIFAILSTVAITALSATSAFAATTQKSVGGESGNAAYPLMVEGADGVVYFCEADVKTNADGQPTRTCIRPSNAGTGAALFAAGSGIAVAGPAIALVLVAAAAAGGGDDAHLDHNDNNRQLIPPISDV